MSELATTRSQASSGPWSYVALAFAFGAAAAWVLAGIVDDGLYLFTGIFGIAAFGAGVKAYRDARRAAARTWPALTGLILGGLLGGLVLAFAIAFAISEL
jgi:hypothetical protein